MALAQGDELCVPGLFLNEAGMGTNTVLMSLRQTHTQLVKAAMLLADLPDTQMLTENKNHRSRDRRAEPSELRWARIHDHLAACRELRTQLQKTSHSPKGSHEAAKLLLSKT